MKTLRDEIDKTITESVFLELVIELAQRNGWRVAHFRPAQTSKGWRTPIQGDGKGYPDLTMVHKEMLRLIFAEIKAERGTMSKEQKDWFNDLYETAAEVYQWKPRDWDAIVATLSRGRA